MNPDTPPIIVITGPTAVGKTAFSVEVAQALKGEIISCDSSLFYKGMDIGTARPTREECDRVRHHCMNLVSPSEVFDVTAYVKASSEAVRAISENGRPIVVTGGSGFYLRTFYGAVADDLVVSDDTRQRVAELSSQGLEAMVEELKRLSPDGLGPLDIRNPRRVAKALERCLAAGLSVTELFRRFSNRTSPFQNYRKISILLERPDIDLYRRIEERVRAMLDQGLIDEVIRLKQEGIERNPSASAAIGYREVLARLNNPFVSRSRFNLSETALRDLCAEICQNTRRLVARQRKWFRTQFQPDCIVHLADAGNQPTEEFMAWLREQVGSQTAEA